MISLERLHARALAQRWLDRPPGVGDPDGDECVLARQYMRALEKIERLSRMLSPSELPLEEEIRRELADEWPKVIAYFKREAEETP